jgi:hypothetical protein
MPCSGKDEGFDEPACACRSSGASPMTPCMTTSQRVHSRRTAAPSHLTSRCFQVRTRNEVYLVVPHRCAAEEEVGP